MNILYATDEYYAELAGVSIESLLDNNKDINSINVYIVEDNVSPENKRKLSQTVEKYNRRIVFLPKVSVKEITGTELVTLRWSECAFSRLYIDRIFMDYPDVERVLYLDCDVMVMGSLETLWETELSGSLGAAVLECMGDWHKRIVGARKTDNYFNSGVMLLDVKEWRNRHASERCTEYIKKKRGRIEYVDQGVINGALGNEFRVIESPRYNLTALSWDFSYEEMQVYRKPDHGYSKLVWEKAMANPLIIHFTTSFLSIRPWYEGSNTPYTNNWREYHEKSEWHGTPLRVMNNQKGHERTINMFRMLPRRLAVGMAGFMHSYIKPLAFMLHG